MGLLQNLASSIVIESGAVLIIFDEGWWWFSWIALGGAQNIFDYRSRFNDVGKVIGAGMPLVALVGKRAIMSVISPLGAGLSAG